MKLVLDNNILFSLMNPLSVSSYLFSYINAKFIAPEFIKSEFEKYKEVILSKSGLSEQEFEARRKEIEKSIEFIEESKYEKLLIKANTNLSDPKDLPYFALALSTSSAIWSNDSHLKKQRQVRVFTTKEIIDMILNNQV